MRPDGGETQNWNEIKAVISDLIINLNYMNDEILYQMPFEELAQEYENHDCHKSEEDGCKICSAYFSRVEDKRSVPLAIRDIRKMVLNY